MIKEISIEHLITPKINLEFESGRFLIKILSTQAELTEAYQLRYQAFQVEMAGSTASNGIDQDEFDIFADHLGIFDRKSGQLIATARFLCSKFTDRFYTEQEFECNELMNSNKVKLEIGRVCVEVKFRKGIIVMLLWRAIATYAKESKAQVLFGCGSVLTSSAEDIALLHRYLVDEKIVEKMNGVQPKEKYRSANLEKFLIRSEQTLSDSERQIAKNLLPPLCQLYFNIGCIVPCVPAFDQEFKCFDFLTVLDLENLDPKVKLKLFGNDL